ncbi:hypothetical protein AB9G23_06185 [Francisella philomiragia]|uniref:hypothetical protein n=1 Tax=Francisella philomiragia TaxID=28110 RepID=UPI001F35D96E|nr:hypothetical protein [Francisella philomiragia]
MYSTFTVFELFFARVNAAGFADPVAPSIAGTLIVKSELSPTSTSIFLVEPQLALFTSATILPAFKI